MKIKIVRDLMVPLAEYATVSQDASLYDAVMSLEEAQLKFDQHHYKHRAILVLNNQKKVVGKLSQLDVIRGLEPGYSEIEEIEVYELSPSYIKSMMKDFNLWQSPMESLFNNARDIKVKDIMYTPDKGEYVKAEATIDEAIHQLVVGRHQSLLVTRGEDVIGIFRLTDLFMEACMMIKKHSS